MAFIPVHESAGLYNQVNELMAPAGAASAANNVSINRDNVAECRPGFSNCSSSLPAGIPRQLYASKDLVFCHINNQLWKQSGDCNWVQVGGGVTLNSVALVADSVYLYIASRTHIRRMRFSDMLFEDLAGDPTVSAHVDGLGPAARFSGIQSLAMVGNKIYAICSDQTLRVIDRVTGAVTTLAGTAFAAGYVDGVGAVVRFQVSPFALGSIAIEGGYAFIIDQPLSNIVRRVDLTTGAVSTVYTAAFAFSSIVSAQGYLFLVFSPGSMYKIDTAGALISIISGLGGGLNYAVFDGGNIWTVNANISGQSVLTLRLTSGTLVTRICTYGSVKDGAISSAQILNVTGMAYGGGAIWILDSNALLRKLSTAGSGNLATIAGDFFVLGSQNGYGILPIIEP